MRTDIVHSREELAAAIQCIEDDARQILYYHEHGVTTYRFPANTVETKRGHRGRVPITDPERRLVKLDRRRELMAARARSRIRRGT